MSSLAEPRLRASEIPQMVDVDGYIDELLCRVPTNTIRPMFDVIETRVEDLLEDWDWWESGRDAYSWCADDEDRPEPASLLDIDRVEESIYHTYYRGRPLAERSPAGVWFVPALENPAAPTVRELTAAGVEIGRTLRRSVMGRFVRRAMEDAAEAERVSEQIRHHFQVNFHPLTDALERAQREVERLQAAQAALRDLVETKPDAEPDDPRERALELRRNRNTGPDQTPFKHRGRR